ncbi:unnamed protein product [Camellia sinensis]
MDSLITASLLIFTGELTSDFMAKDSYVLLSYHAWTFRLSDAHKQLEQVLGLVESMASLMCVDIDFNLDSQEVADDSAGRGSDVNITKLNVVEIVETKIRNAKEEGDDTMKWLELEDLHMDDALLLSLDLPSKFLIKLEWGFKEDLETLRRRLTLIQSLLSDAENQRITSASMREWLKNLKLVTCDAENVLDEFAYEALRRKLEFVGRDGDVSTMIDMLIGSYDSGDDLSVIAIVGMGGMGKTTLGQLVYKNKKVVKYFGSSTRSFGFSSCGEEFEQEAINLTMNLPQHSTWRMESYFGQCPRPSTLKFVDIDKPICKWKNNRDLEFVVLILSQVSHVDNLMFIIGYLIQIKRNQYPLDQLQRLIALKVLSIEDFDGLEALLDCLESIA